MRRAIPLMGPVILGAGPAGCAAAIALAEAGAVPVLLDRDQEAHDQLCGGFLSWRTVAQLRAIGIDPASLGAHRLERLALFAGGCAAIVPLPDTALGLSRRALDEALRRRARAAGARVETDTARGIDGTTVLGRRREWRGDGLFLATGKHDVRGLARPRIARDPALGLRLRLAPSPERTGLLDGNIELHLFGGGYAGIVLQEDGSANVCLAVRKSRVARSGGEPARLLAAFAERHPAFALRLGDDWSARSIEAVGAVPYGWIARDTTAGVFRLGDQAAVIPSLAGEGISIALASGTLAARHWLAHGPEGALAYQHALAGRAVPPMRIARLARAIAEGPLSAGAGVALAQRVPPVVRWLMQASRLDAEPALAYGQAAP
jgi:flavin-dependent dehydrogenase